MKRVLVIHGPNLNLLGTREPEVYGRATLADIDASLVVRGADLGIEVACVQSNSEGGIIDHLHAARGAFDGILINPGGFGHTSVAIRDAILAVGVPTVEVHLSNVHKREAFRHVSMIAGACVGQVLGFGAGSYLVALQALVDHVLH
jgi:3-dehydroquinate dehydratase-2